MPVAGTGTSAIRDGAGGDREAIVSLYLAAMPGENLTALLDELLASRDDVVSLVAVAGDELIGHIAFTRCHLEGRAERLALLAPLAVAPTHQRRGVGSALIGEGLRRLRDDGVARVLVLGDPAYYGRHGFATETGIVPPYPLTPDYQAGWQGLALRDAPGSCRGQLLVPATWMRPRLWSP